MRKLLCISICFFSLFVEASSLCRVDAQTATAAIEPSQETEQITDWLPETTVIFGKMSPLSLWLDHPFREGFIENEAFKKLWRSPQALQLRGGITVAELALGMKLEQLAKDLTEQGVYLAVDAQTNGVALILKTQSQQWLEDYIDKALDYVRRDAKSKGNSAPIESAEYKGVQGYKIQNGIFVHFGPWLIVTNQGNLAKSIIDRKIDQTKGLSTAGWFQEAQQKSKATQSDQPKADFWIDLITLRERINNPLFQNQAKDFGAELILGGVMSVLANAPELHASLQMDEQGLELEFQTPSDPKWYGESREHYVGPNATGHAPNWPTAPGAIATLATYRDIAQMWLRAGDLFDQNTNDQLAQADNTLTTIFAGKDFGTDILGAVEPQLQLFATEPKFSDDELRPAVRLPSFGLIAKLREPAKLQREFKRTFQSFIGFLNVAGAQEGQPQLELDTISQDGNQIYTAKYILDEDRNYPDGLPIQYNFQPTLAFVDDRMVLCSSVETAQAILREGRQDNAELSKSQTWLKADAVAIQKILQANSNPIIAQNMLEKGNSRIEAKREFDTLMLALGLIKQMSMSMEFQEQARMILRLDRAD